MYIRNGFTPHTWINCIDAYKLPSTGDWDECPCCGLCPWVWQFDNGRSTACGCWDDGYDHFSIHAESVMSVYLRTKKTADYHTDGLMNNWNHWCRTGDVLFIRADVEW